MRKVMVFLLIAFSFIVVREAMADWWSFPTIAFPSFPTNTPTPTPKIIKFNPGIFAPLDSTSSTPTPSPTATLTPTPTVEPTIESTVEPTTKAEETIAVSPTVNSIMTITPTKKPEEKKSWSQKDMIYVGVAGFLVLIILLQAWPKIKKFLHEKTA